MEDAHITKADLTDEVSIFGVFDGHGGTNYSMKYILYQARKLLILLKNTF